jgi:hypothetical protein
VSAHPQICWITPGTRRALEERARAEGVPVEEMAGEMICDRLRQLRVKTPEPALPERAEYGQARATEADRQAFINSYAAPRRPRSVRSRDELPSEPLIIDAKTLEALTISPDDLKTPSLDDLTKESRPARRAKARQPA